MPQLTRLSFFKSVREIHLTGHRPLRAHSSVASGAFTMLSGHPSSAAPGGGPATECPARCAGAGAGRGGQVLRPPRAAVGGGRRPRAGGSRSAVSHSCGEAFAGRRCQAHSPCLSAPCKNAGTCHVLERGGVLGYTCSCRLGFSGPLCLTPWDNACLASPCRNGGTCDLLTLTEYKCRCPPGWSGEARAFPGWPGGRGGGPWSGSSSGRLSLPASGKRGHPAFCRWRCYGAGAPFLRAKLCRQTDWHPLPTWRVSWDSPEG